MTQSIIISILTIIFYLSGLLGGGTSPTPSTSPLPHLEDQLNSTVTGQFGQVVASSALVRTGPGTEFDQAGSVRQGEQVMILGAENGWYQVRLNNGQSGWIAGYLLEVAPTTTQSPSPRQPNGRQVLGYYVLNNQSYNSLLKNGNALTGVAPWSWNIDSYGGLNAGFDAAQLSRALNAAGNQRMDTLALIHNYYNEKFDSRVVSTFLNNPQAQERAVKEIRQTIADWGMSGVNLDLENVPAEDRTELTAFVARLASELRPAGYTVTMAVPAKTEDNASNSFSGAYDYSALANHLDYLVIMAYDQHYRLGPAGPVASIQWVEEVVKYAVDQAPSTKVVLGIPAYGYDWPAAGPAKALTYNQAMELAARQGVSVRWHNLHKTPYFEYGNGRQVWFENRYSFGYKAELVEKYDLAGIALWRLGQEDPGLWQTITNSF